MKMVPFLETIHVTKYINLFALNMKSMPGCLTFKTNEKSIDRSVRANTIITSTVQVTFAHKFALS